MVPVVGVGLLRTPEGYYKHVDKTIWRCPVEKCPDVREKADGLIVKHKFTGRGRPVKFNHKAHRAALAVRGK